MALKTPLVLGSDGLVQQLQSGDTISSAVAAQTVRQVTNAESSAAITIGMPVYATAADAVKRAQANAKATSQLAGLVFDVSIAAAATGNICSAGILVATTAQWDAVAGTTGGLTFGTRYFLDPANPGKITSAVPTTAGQTNTAVGIALSTTELELQLQPPILL
ncbi:MAG: hypothetical protein JO290_01360 [Sphingomonadaceae bacterium]|nr:hypothetical protein [Sphingomonadaceae bacterium]